jgi:phosphoserine phosphatase RsbU/P
MARLILHRRDGTQRELEIPEGESILGRQRDAGVLLEGNEISRRHSRLLREGDRFFLEDLGSSNGTFVNGTRIRERTELRSQDEIRIGPYVLRFESTALPPAESLTIFGRTEADTKNAALFQENAASKLRAMLEVSQLLASAARLDEIFDRLLDYLLVLFPKADSGVVVLRERDELVMQGRKARQASDGSAPAFSRSVVRLAIRDGQGILGEDAQTDTRFREAATLIAAGIRAFICAPMVLRSGKVLGAIQLDRLGAGRPFTAEDLNLLTAVTLQVAAVVENAQLHEQVLVKERLERELAVARQIQESFLPQRIPHLPRGGADLFARVYPALEVSGDFYDYFLDEDGKLTFAIADVCGKGMSAALFMTMCLTLLRHLAPGTRSPAAVLEKLNAALMRDNPGMMYVTMVLGKFDPLSGEAVVAYGGHPFGFRKPPGSPAVTVGRDPGSLVGCGEFPRAVTDLVIPLAPGETLLFYTDGVTEAPGGASGTEMFGSDRLLRLVNELPDGAPLEQAAVQIHSAIAKFGNGRPLADDVTLLMLRRTSGPEAQGS